MKNNKYVQIAKRTLNLYNSENMGIYAGNATLFIITAMFPLLMLVIAVVNKLPGYNPSDVTALLFRLLPDLSAFESFLYGIVNNLKNQSGGVLAGVSALTTLWSASAGVTALQNGLKKLGGTKGNGIKDKLRAVLFTFLLVIFIPSVLILQVFGSSIIELVFVITAYLHIEKIAALVQAVITGSGILMALLTFLIILMTYTYLPGYKRELREQVPGALIITMVFILFTAAFSFFIPRFYHSSALYGSLASLFLVLMWLRFVMMMFFAGDSLNIALKEYKEETNHVE